MNEVKKMYENAGVEKSKCWDDCTTCTRTSCDKTISYIKAEYPPFTAEKLLKILKIIVHSYGFNALDKPIWGDGWAVAIARLVNIYWEVLSEKEKQQVKGILE